MSLDTDAIIDRRRLKRALTFWRIAALVVAATLGAVWAGQWAGVGPVSDYVAELTVDGLIVDDPDRISTLEDLADDDRAKALVVRIDSPGGTVVGGEALYRALRAVAKDKPVVAVMGELATSAGYMVALGGERIIASRGSLTGSIGVLLQTADVTGLMGKLGIKPETVKSAPLKAQPNPLEPFTPEAREATKAVVMDMYALFVDMVAERRNMTPDQVRALADGRVFTGRQAKENGLIDQLGGMAEAREWLAESHGIDTSVPLKAIEDAEERSLLGVLGEDAMSWAGLGAAGELFGKMVFSEGVTLDGLVSVWHPGSR